MRNLFFLTAVFSLTISLAAAQTTTIRAGAAQPTAATSRPTAASVRVDTATPSKRNNEIKKSTEKQTVKSRETQGATAQTSGRNTKKSTIPATTNTGNTRSGQQTPVKAAPLKTTAVPLATIKWLTIEEALEKSKTDKRKIFVDVYTDWCGWCKHMDSTTFKDQAIVSYINEKYYPVKFNAEQTSEISYKGKNYKFIRQQGGRGYHELAALWLNNRLSYPTSVVLNEEQDLIQPIPGFQDSKKMDAILHYFGTDSHRKTPWEKYEKNYGRDK